MNETSLFIRLAQQPLNQCTENYFYFNFVSALRTISFNSFVVINKRWQHCSITGYSSTPHLLPRFCALTLPKVTSLPGLGDSWFLGFYVFLPGLCSQLDSIQEWKHPVVVFHPFTYPEKHNHLLFHLLCPKDTTSPLFTMEYIPLCFFNQSPVDGLLLVFG